MATDCFKNSVRGSEEMYITHFKKTLNSPEKNEHSLIVVREAVTGKKASFKKKEVMPM